MTPPTSGKSHAFPSLSAGGPFVRERFYGHPSEHIIQENHELLCLFIFYLSTRCIRANEEEWIDTPPVPDGGYSCPFETHKHHRYFHEPFPASKKGSPAKVCD